MTFFQSLRQFLAGCFQLREAPSDLFQRERQAFVFICPTCRREFETRTGLRGHLCRRVS
jgi:hypothetical protein